MIFDDDEIIDLMILNFRVKQNFQKDLIVIFGNLSQIFDCVYNISYLSLHSFIPRFFEEYLRMKIINLENENLIKGCVQVIRLKIKKLC